jgi:hypothetical protein
MRYWITVIGLGVVASVVLGLSSHFDVVVVTLAIGAAYFIGEGA